MKKIPVGHPKNNKKEIFSKDEKKRIIAYYEKNKQLIETCRILKRSLTVNITAEEVLRNIETARKEINDFAKLMEGSNQCVFYWTIKHENIVVLDYLLDNLSVENVVCMLLHDDDPIIKFFDRKLQLSLTDYEKMAEKTTRAFLKRLFSISPTIPELFIEQLINYKYDNNIENNQILETIQKDIEEISNLKMIDYEACSDSEMDVSELIIMQNKEKEQNRIALLKEKAEREERIKIINEYKNKQSKIQNEVSLNIHVINLVFFSANSLSSQDDTVPTTMIKNHSLN